MIPCANETCETLFEPSKHNQIYHSPECCRIATNRKIMKKYYEKKARLNGAQRICDNCGTVLSRYNSDTTCSACLKRNLESVRTDLLRVIGAAD